MINDKNAQQNQTNEAILEERKKSFTKVSRRTIARSNVSPAGLSYA